MKRITFTFTIIFLISGFSSVVLGEDFEKIDESNILQKMQKEIGDKIDLTNNKKEKTVPGESTIQTKTSEMLKDESRQNVTVLMKNGAKFSGNIILTQKSLIVLSEAGNRKEIELSAVKILSFDNWKADHKINISKELILPQKCLITLKSGPAIEGYCELQGLLKITVDDSKPLYLYSNESKSENDIYKTLEFHSGSKEVKTATKIDNA